MALRVTLKASRLLVVMHTASMDAGEAGSGQAVNQCRMMLAPVNSAVGLAYGATGIQSCWAHLGEYRAHASKLFHVGVF